MHNYFHVLVVQSEESEVQTETKPDEDKPGECFNWSISPITNCARTVSL